jgi:hypothetical protein
MVLSVPEGARCRAEHTGPPARSRPGVDRVGGGRQRAVRRTTRAAAERLRHLVGRVALGGWGACWGDPGDRESDLLTLYMQCGT